MAVRFIVNNEEMLQCLWRFFSLLQMYTRDPVTILAWATLTIHGLLPVWESYQNQFHCRKLQNKPWLPKIR